MQSLLKLIGLQSLQSTIDFSLLMLVPQKSLFAAMSTTVTELCRTPLGKQPTHKRLVEKCGLRLRTDGITGQKYLNFFMFADSRLLYKALYGNAYSFYN